MNERVEIPARDADRIGERFGMVVKVVENVHPQGDIWVVVMDRSSIRMIFAAVDCRVLPTEDLDYTDQRNLG